MSIPDSFDEFGLYENTGFILELPESLPGEFAIWNELAPRVEELIYTEGGMQTLKDAIRKMPKLNSKAITSYGELSLAHLQLGFLAAGWVHGDPHNIEKSIPECIAVPLCDVAERLGMLPSLTYYANMTNWIRLDRNGPYTRENLRIRYKLLGRECATEFFYVQSALEFNFSKLIPTIKSILEESKSKDEVKVLAALNEIHEWIKDFLIGVKGYHAKMDPEVFYKELLTLFHGFNRDTGLPEGVIYEGVSDKPKIVPTTAASETCIFQILECLLRLELAPETEGFFKSFRDERWNFPTRKFYKFLEMWPGNVREMAMTSKSEELGEIYNKIIEDIKQFRSFHIQLIAKFFIIPYRKEKGKDTKTDQVGELIPFLKGIRESVASHKI